MADVRIQQYPLKNTLASGDLILIADSADVDVNGFLKYKKVLSSTLATSISRATTVTYAELQALVASSALIQGSYYVVSNAVGGTLSLLVQAVSANLIAEYAVSTTTSETYKYDITVDTAVLEPNPIALGTANQYLKVNSAGTAQEYENGAFVRPEWYGAVGDGITNDTIAIQASVDTGLPVLFSKATYLVTTINIPVNTKIIGVGRGSVLKSATNAPIFSIVGLGTQTGNTTIVGLTFLGDGKGATYNGGKTSQNGIYIESSFQNIIQACYGESLGGALVSVNDAHDYGAGNQISDCVAYDCNIGFEQKVQGEYSCISNCTANLGNYGVRIYGGNVSIVGCNFTYNKTGVKLEGGANNSHGVVSACKINHNSDYSIHSDGVTIAFTFDSNMLFYGTIYLKDSIYVNIKNGEIFAENIYLENSFDCEISGNYIENLPVISPTHNTTTSRVFFKDNKYKTTRNDGTFLQNIKGGYVKRHADGTIVSPSTELIIDFNNAVSNSISNNNNYTTDSFWDSTNKVFVNKQYNAGQVTISGYLTILEASYSDKVYFKIEILNVSDVVDRTYNIYNGRILSGTDCYSFINMNNQLVLKENEKIRIKLINSSAFDVTFVGGSANGTIEVFGL